MYTESKVLSDRTSLSELDGEYFYFEVNGDVEAEKMSISNIGPDDEDVYVVRFESAKVKAVSESFYLAFAKLMQYIKNKHYSFQYELRYYSNGEDECIELVVDETPIFRAGVSVDEPTTERSWNPSYWFWSNLVDMEDWAVKHLERTVNTTAGNANMYRLKYTSPKYENSIFERELLINLSRYMSKYYSSNKVLTDEPPLHNLLSTAVCITGRGRSRGILDVYDGARDDIDLINQS